MDKYLIIAGLILNFIGIVIIWWFTPDCFKGAVIYTDEDLKKNKLIRLGMLIIGIGFLFQLAGYILPLCHW